MKLRLGEKIVIKGRTITVTAAAYEALPRTRDYLVEVARSGGTVTYGDLIADARLPYIPNGIGRFLDLLSVDCERRSEPSLAALVVGKTTREVGSDFGGDAVEERQLLYSLWR